MTYTGYEAPVQIPNLDVYDTTMMRMYLQEAKNQYEQGKEEMKDFMKMYNDFYSPVPGATEAYNNMTIGGARNMINQMLANGIDPYKSPEARAAISRYIASVPAGRLNQMRQWAENAKEYKAMEAKMKADGTWGNDDFQRAMLGGKLLEEWDPNTPFTANSPYKFKSLYELALPQFQKYGKTENLGPGSRPFTKKMGVSDASKSAATEATIKEIDASPYAAFYRDQARNDVLQRVAASGRNITPEQLEQLTDAQYRQNVLDVMNSYLQPQEVDDNIALTVWKQQQEAAEHAKNRQLQRDLANAKDKPQPTDRTPLSRQIIDSSNLKILNTFRKEQNDRITQFVNKAIEWRKNNPTENGKKQKSPEEAKQWWEKALQDPVKYKLIDKKGNFTNTAKTWFNRTGIDLRKQSTIHDLLPKNAGSRSLSIAADKMYNKYINYDVSSPKLQNYLNKVYTQTDLLTTPLGETGQVRITYSSDRNLHFTPIRRIKVSGGSKLITNIQNNFERYLQNNKIQLLHRDNNLGVAGIPKRGGKNSIDVFGNNDMRMEDFENFCNSYGYDKDTALRALGLSVYDSENNKWETIDEKKGKYKNFGKRSYVRVPMTRTLFTSNADSYETTPFDEEWENVLFGGGEAAKSAITVEENSLR